jgi:type IV secretion system protein VirB4
MGRVNTATARRAELAVGGYLPYSHHLTPSILATRGGEYLSVWRIGGRSHETASADDLCAWVADLNNAVRGIGTAGVSFWSHVVRRRVDEYPAAEFADCFCSALDARYAASLRECSFLVNELYLTVITKTAGEDGLEFLGRFERATAEEKDRRQADGMKRLEELNRVLRTALKRYDPELLETYERDGHVFSRPLEFLAQLVNGERLPMPVSRSRFGDFMVVNRPFFAWHGEVGEVRQPTRSRCFGMLEVVEYDGGGSAPGELNRLLGARFEFVLSQSFSCLSKQAGKGFLERHKQRLVEAEDVAKSQVADIDSALDRLMSGEFVLGEHHATLLAWDKDAEEVREHLAWARAELLDRGIVAKPLDLALEAAFWAQLPANWSYRPRPCAITSQNFLCFSPFHNFMSGKPAGNPWGPAVTVLRTVSGAPLYFSFHSSPPGDHLGQRLLGNTAVLGQSSSGKTVLLGFLIAQAQKFRPSVVVFDKDRGMEIAVRAMGGRYYPLKLGEPTGWNPFQLEGSLAGLLFLKELVKLLLAGEALSTREDQEIEGAIQSLMTHIDPKDRRLSVLVQFCPAHLAARLRKWTAGGQYGWVFDNQRDTLDLSTHRFYGFDYTEFLDEGEVRRPMMRYLLARTKAMLDGRRFIWVFDEWWRALRDESLAALSEDQGRTVRKQDGLLLLATQDPHEALRSEAGKASLKQCATLILLRNPIADREDYVDGLKLTPAEFELVRTLPEDSRRFLVKQGDHSAVAELDLGALQADLKVLSGTPDRAALAQELAASCGDDPSIWLPLFWEKLGVTT